MSVQTLIQIRRGTAAEWISANSTLHAGEWGYETDTGRYKIGDGTTVWGSLKYSAILPRSGDIAGASGINITFNSTSGIPVTIALTGIASTQVTDFNTAVSALITSAAVSPSQVMNIVNSGLAAGSNIGLSYNSGTNIVTISVTGLSIGTNIQAYDAGLTSIASLTTSSDNYLYTTGSDTYTTGVITGFGRTLLDDSDAATARNTLGLGSISTQASGDYALLNSPALTGTPTAPTAAADTNTTQIASTAFVLGQASSSNPVMDGSATAGSSYKYARADHVHPSDTSRAALAGATFTGSVTIPSGSGNFTYLNIGSTPVSVSGHTHTSSNITDFNSSVSGLLGVKSLVAGTGIGITNNNGAQTIAVTGIPSSLITDLGNIATTEVIGRTGIQLTYDAVYDKMYIDATGLALSTHTHIWSDITDASTRATLSELAYLSGVTAGTVSASRVLVVDSNKSITGLGSISTTGNLTVAGDLTINGTTTTVNSTTVDIGDNIIRVNVSGAATQGGLEVKNTATSGITQLVWDTINSRWEFSGGNVYTSGYFVGSLSGNASTVTNGIYTTDTGTVTSTMIANDTIVNADINSAAAIAYSKLNLSNSITNSDISTSAAIAVTKLASSGVTLGSTTVNLGQTTSSINGLTSISGTSAGSPTTLYYCVIDGGTP